MVPDEVVHRGWVPPVLGVPSQVHLGLASWYSWAVHVPPCGTVNRPSRHKGPARARPNSDYVLVSPFSLVETGLVPDSTSLINPDNQPRVTPWIGRLSYIY